MQGLVHNPYFKYDALACLVRMNQSYMWSMEIRAHDRVSHESVHAETEHHTPQHGGSRKSCGEILRKLDEKATGEVMRRFDVLTGRRTNLDARAAPRNARDGVPLQET